MDVFIKIVKQGHNNWKLLTISVKSFTLDVWLCSDYTSAIWRAATFVECFVESRFQKLLETSGASYTMYFFTCVMNNKVTKLDY